MPINIKDLTEKAARLKAKGKRIAGDNIEVSVASLDDGIYLVFSSIDPKIKRDVRIATVGFSAGRVNTNKVEFEFFDKEARNFSEFIPEHIEKAFLVTDVLSRKNVLIKKALTWITEGTIHFEDFYRYKRKKR